MSRKILLFIIGLFFLIGLGFLIYQYLQPTQTATSLPPSEIQNPFGNFFPTQNTPVNNVGQTPVTDAPETINFSEPIKKLRKISANPVAGSTVFDSTASATSTASTLFRYVERATGHIYEMTATSTIPNRISNTTIPSIYEAFFLDSKNQVAFRYLEKNNSIETYIATVRATSTPDTAENKTYLEGSFMLKDITSFSVSPNGKNILTTLQNTTATNNVKFLAQIGATNNITKQTSIFTSPVDIWIGDWFANDIISMITKPSYTAQGVLYFVNVRTGVQEKKLGPIYGLMAKASPNGRKIIYSRYTGTGIATNIVNTADNISKRVPVTTLADKCVWSKDNIHVYCAVPANGLTGQYPDVWYMGLVSLNDSLIKINTELETTSTIMTFGSETPEPLDMVNLQLSPKEDFLVFTNKRDLSLWSLDIKQN